MRLNLEKQTIITVGIFAGIIVLILLGVILPTAKYIVRLNNETTNLKNYLEKKYETTTHMRSSIKKMEEVKQTVDGYNQYFFRPGDELALITALENIATKNKVDQKIEYSNLDQKNIDPVKVTLSINGEYQNTLKYLADLEKLNYFINIEKIQISGANKFGAITTTTQANLFLDFSLYVNH